MFDLFMVAFCSGLFVVPLFAFMQARTPFYRRARIVGANNIMNAVLWWWRPCCAACCSRPASR